VDHNYERASKVLREHIDQLHAMADALIKFETIDRGQIDNIMAGKPPGKPSDWDESDLDATKPDISNEDKSEESSEKKSGTDELGGPVSQP